MSHKDEQLLCCSFCGRREDQVRLIAGPGVNICSDCVSACSDLLREELELEQEQEEAVNESKPLMGFLGALLGAALGCLLIVLLPQIGLTPAFGGIIIAPFIFIGYSILCKGKTKSGLGVCIMFSIFTP